MEHKDSDKVLAFDTIYTSNHIAIMKILLSLFEAEQQQNMVVFIKYLELQYTLSITEQNKSQIKVCSSNVRKPEMTELLDDIKLYCSPSEKQQLDQISNMQSTMSMMKDMQSMMGMMEGIQGDTSTDKNDNPSNDMLKSMLSPEQLAMFEMFKGGF